jgi:GNAT superfamily N-acetyltransferase
MDTEAGTLPLGYSPVAAGHVANVVTCLEMTAPVPPRPAAGGFELRAIDRQDLAAYRALFREVGEDWLWFSRLVMPDGELAAILGDPRVELLALHAGGGRIGLLELDFRQVGVCELAFFGVAPQAIGSGAGRYLMNEAIGRAWARPIRRLWVHTCTFDHPNALAFYLRSGFTPFARMVEVAQDPRLSGHLPRRAAAHVPILE